MEIPAYGKPLGYVKMHAFHSMVAMFVSGVHETIYMEPTKARELGEQLIAFANRTQVDVEIPVNRP